MSQFIASEKGRLDQIIAKQFSVSVSVAKQFIASGNVKIKGKPARKGDLIEAGQTIEAHGEPLKTESFLVGSQPELALTILYEDKDLVAIEKPSGMPTHPLQSNETGTLANALIARYPECAQSSDDARECGIAHRLDIETSGVLLAARNKETFLELRHMFTAHKIEKTYLAVVIGKLTEPIEICEKIGHDPKNQKKAVVMPEGRLAQKYRALEALTQIEPLASVNYSLYEGEERSATLIKATTIFGRMHQIRVHMAHIGHPLLGDSLYDGPPQNLFPRSFFLHASALRLAHPVTQKELNVQTKQPNELLLFE